MADSNSTPDNHALMEMRRELHELAVLSSALMRLATRVQARREALRQRMGSLESLDEEELNRRVSWVAAPASDEPAPRASGARVMRTSPPGCSP